MGVQVNWLAVVLATASSMAVGAAWYARPVFGGVWARLVKLDDKKLQQGAGQAIGITILASFLTAYVLAHVVYLSHAFFGNSFLQDALTTAFWLWLGLTAPRFITHDTFERRPFKLTFLNISHELVTLLVMALIIGLLRP